MLEVGRRADDAPAQASRTADGGLLLPWEAALWAALGGCLIAAALALSVIHVRKKRRVSGYTADGPV